MLHILERTPALSRLWLPTVGRSWATVSSGDGERIARGRRESLLRGS